MDMKVSRNYAAYQRVASDVKHTGKSLSAPVQAAGKARGGAICIDNEDMKISGASSFSAALSGSMEEGVPADRITAIKQQVRERTHQMPAEQIARRLMSGLQEGKISGEIVDFLEEYTEALEAMEQKQIEKLELLMTRELDRVEQTIMMQEAMNKKLENMEQRRRKLFVSYGIEGRILKQVAGDANPEQRKELMDLYHGMDGAIDNVQCCNQKAETLAKSELEQMRINFRYVGNPTGIYGRPAFSKGSKLEKKA